MHKTNNYLVIAIISLFGVIVRSTVRIQLFGNKSLVLFFTELYIGNPPVRQKIHVDTGSPLTTIKCSDCKICIDKKSTNYNELQSFTSKKITCNSRLPICEESCKSPKNDGYCHFLAAYADGTTVIGNLIEDQIRFSPNDDSFNAQFGCMKFQTEFYQANLDGLLGVSPNFKKNILNKWFQKTGQSNQFSLCLGENGGYMDIGGDQKQYNYQKVLKYQMTLQIFSVYGLETISYGQTQIYGENDNYDLLLFDTGSTYSYFPLQTYLNIMQKVREICQNYQKGCLLASKGSSCMRIIVSSKENSQILQEMNHIFPSLQFKIDGHIFTWKPSEYTNIIQKAQENGDGQIGLCFTFEALKGLGDKSFILGMYWMIGKRFKFNLKDQTISILTNQQCKYTHLQQPVQSNLQKIFTNFVSIIQDYIFVIVIVFIFLVAIFGRYFKKCCENIANYLRRIPTTMVRLYRFMRRPSREKKKPNRGNKMRSSKSKKKQKVVSPPKAIQLSAQSQQIQTSTIQQT